MAQHDPSGAVTRYDDEVKSLCAAFPQAIVELFGLEPGPRPLRVVSVSESVPARTNFVDALVLVDDDCALHLEFQAGPESGSCSS